MLRTSQRPTEAPDGGPSSARRATAVRSAYAPGNVIGAKYQLQRVIGRGGMGAVWLARNLSLDVDVAIKLVRADVASAAAATRLLREARAAARLDHPSIVRVYDFGVSRFGDPYIVMEVVRGESLAELFERHARMSALNAVQLLLPIASALAAAHDRGIIHRDIKPENIILMNTSQGAVVPKLVDFGIAKVADESSKRLTQEGSLLGTPVYMSPEQVRGSASLDERTDIWSFCVVLYETIVGRVPFDGPTAASVYGAILADAATPIVALGAGDAELWQILERGLSKDPSKRWQHMRSVGRAMAEWAHVRGSVADCAGVSLAQAWFDEGERSPAPAHRMHTTRRWVAATAIGASLIGAGGAAFVATSGDTPSLGAATRETRTAANAVLTATPLPPVKVSSAPVAASSPPKPAEPPRRTHVVAPGAIAPGF